jgi:hypothetical protein
MTSNVKYDQTLRRYLLGDLGEETQRHLEERLVTDTEYFQELLIVEDELVDEYVRGDLSEQEKEDFESHFLCSRERREKLSFAGVLRDYVDTVPVSNDSDSYRLSAWFKQKILAPLRVPSPALGAAMAAAILVTVIGVVWLIAVNWQLHRQLNGASAEQRALRVSEQDLQKQLAEERNRGRVLTDSLQQEQDQRTRLEREIASLRAQQERSAFGLRPSGVPIASFLLAPGLLRGSGEMERVIIPTGSSLVQLQLDIGVDDYVSYRAALHEVEGDQIWTQSKLKAETIDDKTLVVLTLPSQLLQRGDYYLRLSGLSSAGESELIARYHFRAIAE